jgi:hypothetical protein
VSGNLLRAQSAASRVPPKILTYVQVCSGFRLPPLLAAWAPRDDFWTHLEHHHVYTLAISVESCKLSKVSIHGTNRLKYDVFTRE